RVRASCTWPATGCAATRWRRMSGNWARCPRAITSSARAARMRPAMPRAGRPTCRCACSRNECTGGCRPRRRGPASHCGVVQPSYKPAVDQRVTPRCLASALGNTAVDDIAHLPPSEPSMRTWLIVPFSALLATSAHAAGPEAGRFSMSLIGGVDMPLSGDVHDGAVAAVPDLGPLNPDLAGVSAELRIGAREHDRIYDLATTYGVEFAYAPSDRSEIFGQVRRTEADEGMVQVGGAYVPALATELPVYGTFEDYSALSAEVGYRMYFGTAGTARPFVGARIGATRVDEIRATFEIPDAGITIANAPFYDSGWVASGGLDVGVIVPFGETFSMTLASGVRYTADLKD